MTLAPLAAAPFAIKLHAVAAIASFLLGIVQLAAPKGTLPHRAIGWVWVCLMAMVAISAFWIHNIDVIGGWSPIHLLSILVLVMLPLGVWRARSHRVEAHRWTMVGLFAGALAIAGLFTLLPDRIMNAVLFGG